MAFSVGTSFPQPPGWWLQCVITTGYTHTAPCPSAVLPSDVNLGVRFLPLLLSLCQLGSSVVLSSQGAQGSLDLSHAGWLFYLYTTSASF